MKLEWREEGTLLLGALSYLLAFSKVNSKVDKL